MQFLTKRSILDSFDSMKQFFIYHIFTQMSFYTILHNFTLSVYCKYIYNNKSIKTIFLLIFGCTLFGIWLHIIRHLESHFIFIFIFHNTLIRLIIYIRSLQCQISNTIINIDHLFSTNVHFAIHFAILFI